MSVADLHSKILDARPPGSKFFQFHTVWGEIWQNPMLTPQEDWRPHIGEILDPPLYVMGGSYDTYLLLCDAFPLCIVNTEHHNEQWNHQYQVRHQDHRNSTKPILSGIIQLQQFAIKT